MDLKIMAKASFIIPECSLSQDFKTAWGIFLSGSDIWECAGGSVPKGESFFLTGIKTLTLQCSTREIGSFGKGGFSCSLLVKQKKAVPCVSPEPQCYFTIVTEFPSHMSGEIRNVEVNK